MLHDSSRYKPFTLSPIVDEGSRAPTEPDAPARIVVGLLVDAYAAPVLAALHDAAEHQIAQTRYRTVDVAVHAVSYAEVRVVAHLVEPRQPDPEHRFRRGAVGTVTFQLAEPTAVPGDARRRSTRTPVSVTGRRWAWTMSGPGPTPPCHRSGDRLETALAGSRAYARDPASG
ncbi:hypothetical protein O7623_09675 [Solwaraspora sp. WMMD791]|uniref:hypothetical protein n=1 Tax=Solwaraspora sp. WMMD791 TaxID=3016086 RepID=UPI00249BF17D|nr:hypothetical protein [Solwaraspora sp. WMMD791]WFE29430.1 hypothetical protein O7623_09675 [Solwaraspora sp. WMMD791]